MLGGLRSGPEAVSPLGPGRLPPPQRAACPPHCTCCHHRAAIPAAITVPPEAPPRVLLQGRATSTKPRASASHTPGTAGVQSSEAGGGVRSTRPGGRRWARQPPTRPVFRIREGEARIPAAAQVPEITRVCPFPSHRISRPQLTLMARDDESEAFFCDSVTQKHLGLFCIKTSQERQGSCGFGRLRPRWGFFIFLKILPPCLRRVIHDLGNP